MEFLATEEACKVLGRSLMVEGTRYLSYSGSSISFTFVGRKASCELFSDAGNWDETLKGWMAVYYDEETEPALRFECEDGTKEYVLFESEEKRQVTIRLERYSEAAFAKCGVKKLWIDTEELLPPPEKKQRKIEIIGDSITCGYGVEAKSELMPFHTAQENPEKSYSLRTARALDADVHLVSWSGIGVISRYVEPEVEEPLNDWLMPMLYRYTDASVSKDILKQQESDWEKWDFTRFVPDLIVVNLGTNDASYCREVRERHEDYARAYGEFLSFIRKNNKDAKILCVLGTMDHRLCETLEKTVHSIGENNHDTKLFYYHLPLQLDEDGKGADYHPSDLTQKKTAELMVAEIKRIMEW